MKAPRVLRLKAQRVENLGVALCNDHGRYI